MEALATIGLVGNIVQFVDFGSELIDKSIELYHSYDGALAENVDIEAAAKHLAVLIKKLEDDAIVTGDEALQDLSRSCRNAANDLLAALNTVKVKNTQQKKWESIRKALRSVWSKEKIRELEQRLAKFKEELNLHVVVQLREQVSQFKREHLNSIGKLDLATKCILDAIVDQHDVFQATHEAQLTLARSLHEDTMRKIDDTHQKMIREIKQQQPDISQQERWLDKLPVATQAAFNSAERQHDPTCLPNTRVSILKDIRAWADGKDKRHIFWLNGLAGTGKSTISRTIAREYFEQGRLGASFFFSRGGGDVSHAGKVFTTIASQLAKKSSLLKNSICRAVSENSDIQSQSLRDQWCQLILQPLLRLAEDFSLPPYLLVIDALDECEGENDIRIILQLLAEASSETVPLRIFLTSRPEIPIRHGFYQIPEAKHQDFVLHRISPSIVDHDIWIFLEYNLRLIGQERCLDVCWPGEQVIKRLVQNASGLFIWAATACRFVREGKRFADKRLTIILETGGSIVTAPEKRLNDIYITVLKHSISVDFTADEKEDQYKMLRLILGSIVVLFLPLSTNSLAKLLHVTAEEINHTLEDLYAILDIPKNTGPLRLHHPSFRDFLLDIERCRDTNFWVDKKLAHRTLTTNCLRLMSSYLKQDICGVVDPGTVATDVESRVEQYLPPEVQYACLYWVQHLQNSGDQLHDDDQVHQFLQVHLLHWLEALSWMRKISEGILAIISLESIALATDCLRLHTFLHDTKRFVRYHRSTIEQAPLQAYLSALVFSPTRSVVRNQFQDRALCWIRKLPDVQTDWNSLLQILEGHSNRVTAMAFSPDSMQLASASYDKTIRLWDTTTGAALQTFEGHSSTVNAVVFSPDGKQLASASLDSTVRLWDAATGAVLQTLKHPYMIGAIVSSPDGKQLTSGSGKAVWLWDVATGTVLRTLEGHSRFVNAVAFSPDGKQLASASDDKTVRLWDVATGAVLKTLGGHLRSVMAVTFSPDGKQLASASRDKTVRIWDMATGAALQTFEDHLRHVKAVAFSSDSKQLVSDDGTVRLWDVATGAVLQTFEAHSYWFNTVAFSPDGKQLASAPNDNTVRLWDMVTVAAPQTPNRYSGRVNSVAFSPDGKQLASASSDKTVRLWEVATEALLQTLEGHSDWVNALAFSPDGKQLASASDDETVRLWDVATGAVLQTFEGLSDMVKAVAFSPDGKQLASSDEIVQLWDVATGAVLQTFEGHSDSVSAVAISPDGKQLASASDDETVRLWDVATGAVLQMFKADTKFLALKFSANGLYLETCQGTIDMISLSLSTASSLPNVSRDMFFRQDWAAQGTKTLLWLPLDYRPYCAAVCGRVVGLGCASGRVLFLEFVS